MSKIENPPAFPACRYRPGMTQLDWFAGQALAGLCANAAYLDVLPKTGEDSAAALSQVAYDIAAAMLTARKEKSGE